MKKQWDRRKDLWWDGIEIFSFLLIFRWQKLFFSEREEKLFTFVQKGRIFNLFELFEWSGKEREKDKNLFNSKGFECGRRRIKEK
jgi:hypothetical protein